MIEFIFGGFLILIGLPQVIWSYKIARFGEQIDSIGSRRSWDSVEPTWWRVGLTKLVGIGMIIIGVILVISGIL